MKRDSIRPGMRLHHVNLGGFGTPRRVVVVRLGAVKVLVRFIDADPPHETWVVARHLYSLNEEGEA